MRFYTQSHRYYCGIDLHTRWMYLCILDPQGEVLLHRNLRACPETFLKAVEPYRQDLVVAVECIFSWYWLADLCAEHGIEFVLGHALYMKAIHGGKAKNDRIDSQKIAVLLRGGMIPVAYVYPSQMRSTRDLLRRRTYLMRKRAELLVHVQHTNSQYNLPEIEALRISLEQCLAPLIHGLQKALEGADGEPARAADPEQVKVAVEQLSRYLAESDAAAIDYFESTAPHLRTIFSAPEFEHFASLIENFAFSEAYEQLIAAGEKNTLTPKI